MNKTLVGVVIALLIALGIIAGVKYFAPDGGSGKGQEKQTEPTQPEGGSQNPGTAAPALPAGGKANASKEGECEKENPGAKVPSGNVVVDGKPVKVEGSGPQLPTSRSVVRRPLEPEATKRLHNGPVIVSSVFEASGKGEYAQYGGLGRGSYLYTTTVMAQSEIRQKYEDKETGRVRVEELRKFLQSRDNLSLSKIDFAIALDTLPVDQVQKWANGVCHVVSCICTAIAPAIPPAAPWLLAAGGGAEVANAAVNESFQALHMIDGVGARGLLGVFGVKIPENLERFANERIAKLVSDMARDVHNAIQSIEGKSFVITYEQEKNGAPLNVDYKNEDGSPITDAEWEILRGANVFLDSNVVPDARCRIGDSWTIWADEVMEMFGMAGSGRTDGKIRVNRVADQPDGAWTLKVEPSEIEYKSDNGASAGTMQVKDGNGLVDAENASVKSLQATAGGDLRSISKKRHLLFFEFVKRIKGDSNLRFTLSVDPVKAEPKK